MLSSGHGKLPSSCHHLVIFISDHSDFLPFVLYWEEKEVKSGDDVDAQLVLDLTPYLESDEMSVILLRGGCTHLPSCSREQN